MALRSITLRSSGVTSLQASWEKPPGDVDSYRLTLLQDRCVSGSVGPEPSGGSELSLA